MGSPGEFAELIHAGGALVEFNERRINGGQIQAGIRTAETPEARISCRGGLHREQLQNAAAERVDDVRQLPREVAQFAGGRNDGTAAFVELAKPGFEFVVAGGRQIFCRAKQPRERAVNDVGGADKIRVYADTDVRAVGPMLPAFGIEQVRLGLEIAGFGQRQFNLPAVAGFPHRQIAPRSASGNGAAGVGGDDFPPQRGRASEVGAEQRAPARLPAAVAQLKTDAIADETHEAFAGGRVHNWNGLRHYLFQRLAGWRYDSADGGRKQYRK